MKHTTKVVVTSLLICFIVFFSCVLVYCIFVNNRDYKNQLGYENYIIDIDSGCKDASYFNLDSIWHLDEKARCYYESNVRRYGQYLITDYEDGVCINRYYGKSKNVNIPETIAGKPVVKLGEYLQYEKSDICDYSESIGAFAGIKGRSLIVPKTVKYISNGSLWSPRGMNDTEDPDEYKKWTSIYKINVDAENPYYYSEDGVLFSKDKKSLLYISTENDVFRDSDFNYRVPDFVENFLHMDGFDASVWESGILIFGKGIKKIDTYFFDSAGFDISENPVEYSPNWIIKGYKGTVAQEWAEKYNLKFISLDE